MYKLETKLYKLHCRPFRIFKATLTGCLAKTGQDQHILFYRVFFEKKHSNTPIPQENICDRNSKSPQTFIIFLPLPF